MIEVDISHMVSQPEPTPFQLIWGMPTRDQLQAMANFDGFTAVILTGGHQHTLTTNKLFHRQLNSLQLKKGSNRDKRTLKHYIAVYSAPQFTDRVVVADYFGSLFDHDMAKVWKAPAGTRRGSLNLVDDLL